MCAINELFLSRLVDIESPLTHSNTSMLGYHQRQRQKKHLPTLIPRSVSGLCLLMVNTSQSASQHCSCWLHSCILSATFTTSSSVAFLASHSLWPCLECAVSRCASGTLPDQLLLDHLVSLGPWCCLLRLATLHPSQPWEDLPSISTKDTTLRTMSRRPWPACCFHGIIHCLFLESLLALLNTHFHVLRADCWCSSAAHTPSARCACKACSLDCSGRCLAKRLHEP